MKKFFTSGLAILLPIVLTLMIAAFFINLVTQPFLKPVQDFLYTYLMPHVHSPYLDREAVVVLIGKLLVLVLIFGFVLLVGFLGKLFLADWFFRLGDWLLHRVPLVNKIYRSCQDLVHSLFSSTSNSFSQVVLVPFPFAGHQSIGFVTKDNIQMEGIDESVAVFVPGTPNPSVGFLLMFKAEELIPLDMTIEEAMKFVVSCGIVLPQKSFDRGFQPTFR